MARELVVRLIGDDQSLRRAFLRSSTGAKGFERDVGSATRGALAGSGAFRSLGRSIAFASGGFLAFGGAAAFLRKSVDAAKEAAVVQKQLEAQFTASGKSLAQYENQIDKTANRLSLLAGFENDEVKAAFLTIFRTTGNVSKALRDTATAADLARAKHLGLGQAALIVAKTEAGNTTLLRRQGFQIGKNAKAEAALATLRQIVAGQAQAGTTEQERFGAVLHETEEIIGTGLLPVVNKYLASGTLWLAQLNESGKLQKNVAAAADGFSSAISVAAGVVKTVDRVTGSFKNTLELLLALKFASFATSAAAGIGLIGKASLTSAERVALLRGSLTKLGAIGAVTVAVEVVIHRKQVDDAVKSLQQKIAEAQQHSKPVQLLAKGESEIANAPGIKQALGLLGIHDVTPESLLKPLTKIKDGLDKVSSAADAMGDKVALAGAKAAHGLALAARDAARSAEETKRALNITAVQRNTFFDNAIARVLLRGGLGNIQQQIGALQRADALIAARIRVTKDVTRKLNLEDQLLQNEAQIRSLNAQKAADALQARQDAAQAAKDRAAKRISDLTARQFRQLGLSVTGDQITPGVANLQKQLSQLSTKVIGSSLDTPKLQSQLARFRKVLSEGLVPKDVRAKIRDMLNDIRDELNKGTGNLTRFRHVSTQALLAGLGLDPVTRRVLQQRLSRLGPGGTVPANRSPAFAGAGANSNTYVTLVADGKTLAQVVTPHQRRAQQRRSGSRRGPWAGHN